MKLTELLKEGMYDKLVGQINKDVFKTMKAAMAGSGTQDKPKKFKGYDVRKSLKPNTKIGDVLKADRKTIYVGEYSDEVSGLDMEVELKFAVTDGIPKDSYWIDGAAEADEEFPSIEIEIGINPEDGESMFSELQPILRDLVRHEIEHITHGNKSAGAKQSKVMRSDTAMRVKIRQNPELFYKYFLLPKEVDANIHGLYSKAKTMKKPYQQVVDSYLDSLVKDGIVTQKNRDLIYKTWKQRIPKIGGIPQLK